MKHGKLATSVVTLLLMAGCGSAEGTLSPVPSSTVVRQADGGWFDTPQDLIKVMNEVGIKCVDATYGHGMGSLDPLGTCWSGSGTIEVTVFPRQLGGGGQSIREYLVLGQNWMINAKNDPNVAIAVKKLIGGKTGM
jgi:hypothetical protein